MYLKQRSSSKLFQMLNKLFDNHTLKNKDEKDFVYTRPVLLDQQYCVEVNQKLWLS